MRSASPRAAFSLLLVVLLIPGCKKAPPHAGDKCLHSENGGLVACEGASMALFCRDLRTVPVPCRGPRGCWQSGQVWCDQSVGLEGESCVPDEYATGPESACAADRKSTLICKAGGPAPGRFVPGRPCRGARGCEDKGAACDQATARAGDPCNTGTAAFGACSEDYKSVLECQDEKASPLGTRGGRFVAKRECPTAKGCELKVVSGSRDTMAPTCDYGRPPAGTACGKGYEFTEVCGAVEGTLLKCDPDTHKFLLSRTCNKGETCGPYQGNRNIPTCLTAP